MATIPERLRQAAARETIARIRRDAKRASEPLKPLLTYIETHLFDRDFLVRNMLRDCKVRDNALTTRFHAEVGLSPGRYISDCRLTVAARLLVSTDLYHWQISDLVAYGEPRSLSRAFKERFGVSLRDYRANPLAAPPSAPLKLISQPLDDTAFEQCLAEKLWQRIRGLGPTAQRRVLRYQVTFTTPALFDLLRHKSREKGREDRQRGIQLAQLALDSLDRYVDTRAQRLPDLKARGWAWLANARRLALDFHGAEADFERAEAEWTVERKERDRVVEGEVYHLKANLRMNQRQFPEAKELLGLAVSMLRSGEDRQLLAKALTLRASLSCYCSDAEAAITDLCHASKLLEAGDSQRLIMSVQSNMVGIFALTGNLDLAERALPAALALVETSTSKLLENQVTWIKGLIAHGRGRSAEAEKLLLSAQQSFVDLNECDHAAVVSLDLAILYSEKDLLDKAIDSASIALEIFRGMDLHRESVATLKILSEAVCGREISTLLLRQTRDRIEEKHRSRFLPKMES